MDERRCHAHHSSNGSPTNSSTLNTQESNSRPNGPASTSKLSEHSNDCFEYAVVSIFDFHYLTQPVQNEELLRKLYIETDLSSYQISEISRWSRTSISDAMRTLEIEKGKRKGPMPQYGIKKEGVTCVQ